MAYPIRPPLWAQQQRVCGYPGCGAKFRPNSYNQEACTLHADALRLLKQKKRNRANRGNKTQEANPK